MSQSSTGDRPDLNIENYTKDELLDIVNNISGMNLHDPSPSQVTAAIKMVKQQTSDPEFADFFDQIQSKLSEESSNLWQTEYSQSSAPPDDNRRTSRLQQVKVNNDEDENFVMFRNKLNVGSVHTTTQLQGELNPNMRNTVVRTANIDSQYRHVLFDNSVDTDNTTPIYTSTTDYSLELSEPLRNVLSIKLHSIHIPTTWYTYSKHIGNTCLEFDDLDAILGTTLTNDNDDFDDFIPDDISGNDPSGNDLSGNDPSGNDLSGNYFVDYSGYQSFQEFLDSQNVGITVPPPPLPNCDCIPDGNYTIETFIAALNAAFSITDTTGNIIGGYISFAIDPASNKLTITNESNRNLRIYFYKPYGVTGSTNKWINNRWGADADQQCILKCLKHSYTNHNLGWSMGFRVPPDVKTGEVYIDLLAHNQIKATAPINIHGSTYFTLALDDYNQNHINNGLINILEKSETVAIPSYYNPNEKDTTIVGGETLETDKDARGAIIGAMSAEEKAHACATLANPKNKQKPFITKNIYAPRRLTNAQIYSINEIITNRGKPRTRVPAPSPSNVLAHLPLSDILTLVKTGMPYVQFGQSLHVHTRQYFGPVNIRKLHVQLFDDKGKVVDLNGHDWAFTMIVEQLYQY